MTLLDDRDITPDERAAIAGEPRPGVWVTSNPNSGQTGDGRVLDQERTDNLIAAELHWKHPSPDLEASIGPPPTVVLSTVRNGGPAFVITNEQRGGIHSDPLVRLLAFRAWGDRDRRWHETVAAESKEIADKIRAAAKAAGASLREATYAFGELGQSMKGFNAALIGALDQLDEEIANDDRQRREFEERTKAALDALRNPFSFGFGFPRR